MVARTGPTNNIAIQTKGLTMASSPLFRTYLKDRKASCQFKREIGLSSGDSTHVKSLSSAIGAKNSAIALNTIAAAMAMAVPLKALKTFIMRDLVFSPCCFLAMGSITAMYLASKVSDLSEGRTGGRSSTPKADFLRNARKMTGSMNE